MLASHFSHLFSIALQGEPHYFLHQPKLEKNSLMIEI